LPSAPADTTITRSTFFDRNRTTAFDICDVSAPKSWIDWKHCVSNVDATGTFARDKAGAKPLR
jgi:hypothetical protein